MFIVPSSLPSLQIPIIAAVVTARQRQLYKGTTSHLTLNCCCFRQSSKTRRVNDLLNRRGLFWLAGLNVRLTPLTRRPCTVRYLPRNAKSFLSAYKIKSCFVAVVVVNDDQPLMESSRFEIIFDFKCSGRIVSGLLDCAYGLRLSSTTLDSKKFEFHQSTQTVERPQIASQPSNIQQIQACQRSYQAIKAVCKEPKRKEYKRCGAFMPFPLPKKQRLSLRRARQQRR